MYAKSAQLYDAIYGWKDYAKEAAELHALIKQHARSSLATLLDVGCGTGGFVEAFQRLFQYEGLDISEEMLSLARTKHPGVAFHQGDMADFDLGQRFDVVACMFSSIGYVGTVSRLQSAVQCMARHLVSGGVLVVEPWWTLEKWRATGTVGGNYVDEPKRKIARMCVTEQRGNMSVMDMHYLVAVPTGVEHFVERHELALFSHENISRRFVAQN